MEELPASSAFPSTKRHNEREQPSPPLTRHEAPSAGASILPSVVKALLIGTLLIGTLIAQVTTGSPHHHNLRHEDLSSSPFLFSDETKTDSSSSSQFLAARFLEDTECSVDCCKQFEDDLCPSENEWISNIPFAIQIILIILLLCLSALFSGLTLGLMSLDKTGLEIVMGGDDPQAAEYAKKIYPVRENGNLLLCTLLLGNVAVNALLSILLAAYAGGIIGFVSSTFMIVIFGEIVPQALVRSQSDNS